ncbi:hypothetical protein PMAYCL1PPCAC_17618, partial [Pristionchus mayeri]
ERGRHLGSITQPTPITATLSPSLTYKASDPPVDSSSLLPLIYSYTMRLLLVPMFLLSSIGHSAILFQGKAETIKSVSSYLARHPASYHHSKFHSTNMYPEHVREERSANQERMREERRLSPPSLAAPANSMKRRTIRSISNAVIESAHCEHVDLVDCSEFSSDEMTCMLTATGMTCCVCTATLRQMNEWKVFG